MCFWFKKFEKSKQIVENSLKKFAVCLTNQQLEYNIFVENAINSAS